MEEEILVLALQNAVEHDGKANMGPIIGKAMALYPELKDDPKRTSSLVKRILGEVNSMGVDQQRKRLEELGGPKELKKRERRTGLPELEGAEDGQVVMRFAPGPSGPLHLGHTRAAILNDEFCKRYDGKFILRLEDTNPEKIDPEAYKMIPEDLEWLGIDVTETYVQSDRFDLYFDAARELLEKGAAYICTMDTEEWKELKYAGKPCEERDLDGGIQLDKWEKMHDGTFSEGEAFLVVKTDLEHRNPAVRDFVGMRIRDVPHPKTGDRYRVFPLYNLSVAIDDHLMGCTHILRGKDHLNNTYRQEYVYRHLGWKEPVFIHYGLVSIPDTILKTSLIKERIEAGDYRGWGDVRLGTVRALAARGFDPAALRSYWVDVGMKSAEIQFSWDNFYSTNRSMIDKTTRRFFFVPSPAELHFHHDGVLTADLLNHPENPEMGSREFKIEPVDGIHRFLVPSEDLADIEKGAVIRLKDLCNVGILDPVSGEAEFAGTDISAVNIQKGRIIQWVQPGGVPMSLIMPDGKVIEGVAERSVRDAASRGENVQFERVGYFRTYMEDGLKANFMHP